MKKFNDIKYQRPNYETIKDKIESLTLKLDNCLNIEDFLETVKKIIDIQNEIEEMYDYIDIQNMRFLDNEFYNDEINYWNNYKPKFDLLFVPFYKIMNNTKFKDELIPIIPENFFNTVEFKLRITSDKVLDLLQKENELKIEYRSLNKNTIDFEKEKLTIVKLAKYLNSDDRNIRKKAHDTLNEYYFINEDKYINILYELIGVRKKIAFQLGFNDYVEYSLYNLRRFGYDYNDIKTFRNNVIKYIRPLCNRLNEIKRKNLNIDKIHYYDTILFKESPKPIFNNESLLYQMQNVFYKIDSQLGDLYKEMLENGYIDFSSRDNKVNFSITNYLVCEKMPAVTGNFKETYHDVITTTHEIGHSYQKYLSSIEDSKHIVSSLLKYPTFEIAEIFSYSIQLIATAEVDSIFSTDDAKKYKFACIYQLISMMPYICLIDEFQETIYKKNNLKAEEISLVYIELAKKYGLYENYLENKNLEKGNYYFRQTHVYSDPFYYIDYALSYFGALAIWSKSKFNMNVFKKIAPIASYYPFKKLIALYDMPNPFTEDAFKEISEMLNQKIDELKLTRKK